MVFSGCPYLKAIDVETNNPAYTSVGGVLFNQGQTTMIEYPGGKVGSYSIPNSVTSIRNDAFRGCTGLTSIIIPNSVTNIAGGAFLGTSLTNVTIPNSVTSIGDYAFSDTSLTNVTIPNSVTSIGTYVFSYCGYLTSVTIPNSLTSIGSLAFYFCENLTSVTIPNGVTSIGDHAFSHTSLTNVTIPNSVTNIGDFAFSVSGLTSVVIGSGVTSIGVGVFAVNGLTSLIIPNSVTTIGDSAFYGNSLTNVVIGSGVTNIGSEAFGYCGSLTRVYFQGNAPTADSTGFADFLVIDPATVYYLPWTTGWSTNFAGLPTAIWNLPYLVILNTALQTNGFGFTESWATNASVVVEASPDLANPKWSALATNTLSGGTFHFSDSQWTNYPRRFYRIRSF
jgi:hypothetical protein